MDKKIILTIGRQFGSGGREIGEKLAEAFGIGFYDRKLISVAAQASGLSPEVFENADEKATDGLAHAFSMGVNYLGMYSPHTDILSSEGLFKFQSDVIRMLAERESCVIVGRCADYILRENPYRLSFFIHNTMEIRVQRVVEMEQVTVEQAKELITKKDKTRASYYNYFSNKVWGMSQSYHLSVDASVLGIDGTVGYLTGFVKEKFGIISR